MKNNQINTNKANTLPIYYKIIVLLTAFLNQRYYIYLDLPNI